MKQALRVLMHERAFVRVADRLNALGLNLSVLTVGVDGLVSQDGRRVPDGDVDPEVFWLGIDFYRGRLLERAFDLVSRSRAGRWSQIYSAGVDDVRFRAIVERGHRLTKSTGQALSMAEFVIAHALSLLHPIAAQAEAQRMREWRRVTFHEISSSRWVLLGFGAVGFEIAKRIRGLGAHLTAVRRNAGHHPLLDAVVGMSAVHDVLSKADVVVLACALNEETRDIADARFFTAMKPGSILINVARGELLVEEDLRIALALATPAHAVLDVFRQEPLPEGHWMWDHPSVRVTAHTSNAGDASVDRADEQFIENLRRYASGDPLLNEARSSDVGV